MNAMGSCTKQWRRENQQQTLQAEMAALGASRLIQNRRHIATIDGLGVLTIRRDGRLIGGVDKPGQVFSKARLNIHRVIIISS